jgi:hypothetical protein
MKTYWCMCSSDMCNGGDLDSIRGCIETKIFRAFFWYRRVLYYYLGYEDCLRNPCQDGTICLDTKEGFTCICAPWQEDCTRCKFVQKNKQNCCWFFNNLFVAYQVGCSCKNGGRCVMNYGSYGCECPYGYTGVNCETCMK